MLINELLQNHEKTLVWKESSGDHWFQTDAPAKTWIFISLWEESNDTQS